MADGNHKKLRASKQSKISPLVDNHVPQIAVWCLLGVAFLIASVLRGWRPFELSVLRANILPRILFYT